MTSKEVIKRLIKHDNPPRFGFDFKGGPSDFTHVGSRRYINLESNPYEKWGDYPELKKISGFSGEVRRDVFGNIYGRFNGKTNGECVYGAIQDWDDYTFKMPEFDKSYRDELVKYDFAKRETFVVAMGRQVFSTLRDARLMTNALMDMIIEPEHVAEFMDMVSDHEVDVIKSLAGCGLDAWFLGDDLGTQESTFVSPETFRELIKPAYRKITDAAHEAGMATFMHSCGKNYVLMEDLIDAGIDVFQFDQPDVYPTEVLASEFAGRVVFYSPVDIQKVLPTGDKEFIESRALEMCKLFRAAGGGWIAKDYGGYADIGVDPKWAEWAKKVIIENSAI